MGHSHPLSSSGNGWTTTDGITARRAMAEGYAHDGSTFSHIQPLGIGQAFDEPCLLGLEDNHVNVLK